LKFENATLLLSIESVLPMGSGQHEISCSYRGAGKKSEQAAEVTAFRMWHIVLFIP